MKTILICCNTLEDELKAFLAESTKNNYEVIWVEAGLHDRPNVLKEKLQNILDEISDVERVIMFLGHCGGASIGLVNGNYELVLPKSDDCLSLILGSIKKRLNIVKKNFTYFLTAGWLKHDESLVIAYKRDSEKFGTKKAEKIYKIMLNHYKKFGLIETGLYNVNEAIEKIKPLASSMNLGIDVLEADLSWFKQLLFGPWTDEDKFLVVKPNETIQQEHLNFLV